MAILTLGLVRWLYGCWKVKNKKKIYEMASRSVVVLRVKSVSGEN